MPLADALALLLMAHDQQPWRCGARSTRRCSTPGSFEDLPDEWQAAVVAAEQSRPNLRIVGSA